MSTVYLETTISMMDDPIVEEVHRARAEIYEECDGSFEKLIKLLRAGEARHPERLVSSVEDARARGLSKPKGEAPPARFD